MSAGMGDGSARRHCRQDGKAGRPGLEARGRVCDAAPRRRALVGQGARAGCSGKILRARAHVPVRRRRREDHDWPVSLPARSGLPIAPARANRENGTAVGDEGSRRADWRDRRSTRLSAISRGGGAGKSISLRGLYHPCAACLLKLL